MKYLEIQYIKCQAKPGVSFGTAMNAAINLYNRRKLPVRFTHNGKTHLIQRGRWLDGSRLPTRNEENRYFKNLMVR